MNVEIVRVPISGAARLTAPNLEVTAYPDQCRIAVFSLLIESSWFDMALSPDEARTLGKFLLEEYPVP